MFEYLKSLVEGYMTLFSMVHKENPSVLHSIYITLSMITEVSMTKIFPSQWARIRAIDSHTYELEFSIRNRVYKHIIVPSRLPPPMFLAIDQDSQNVNEKILPYMGPNYDWYGRAPPSAKIFDCDSIEITWSDGRRVELD